MDEKDDRLVIRAEIIRQLNSGVFDGKAFDDLALVAVPKSRGVVVPTTCKQVREVLEALTPAGAKTP